MHSSLTAWRYGLASRFIEWTELSRFLTALGQRKRPNIMIAQFAPPPGL
jgi:hypothetical protein